MCRLGATCHTGYSVTHDEQFWSLHLGREYGVTYLAAVTELGGAEGGAEERRMAEHLGMVHDPTMQGNRWAVGVRYSDGIWQLHCDYIN